MCILAGAYEPGSSYTPGSRYPSKMGIIIREICNTGHDHTYLVEIIIGHIKCEDTLYKTSSTDLFNNNTIEILA